MKDINLSLGAVEVKSETKKLRATWSMEIAQDLNSYHGLSLEKELKRLLRIENRKNSIKNIFS